MMDKEPLSKEEMAKTAKRDYMRKWRKNNKDKVKASQQRYWEKQYLNISKSTDEEV